MAQGTKNQYQLEVFDLDRIPKNVWIAIAVSFARQLHGEEPTTEQVRQLIKDECAALHANGIVQRPRW